MNIYLVESEIPDSEHESVIERVIIVSETIESAVTKLKSYGCKCNKITQLGVALPNIKSGIIVDNTYSGCINI